MPEVELGEPGFISIAGLMMKQFLDPFLSRPAAGEILREVEASVGVRAAEMEVGLYFNGGQVWIENGPPLGPALLIEGTLDAFLALAGRENFLPPLLRGELRVRLVPRRALLPALAILKGVWRYLRNSGDREIGR